jgi:choline dehydrogenase-like flavoprotein
MTLAPGRVSLLDSSYDYVIVGAGSAGCVVARCLVDGTGATVLFLEADGSGEGVASLSMDWWPWAHAAHASSCRPGTGDACRKAGRPRPWARDRGRKNGPGHATAPD